MKKNVFFLLSVILILFGAQNAVFAQVFEQPKNITLIYINGSHDFKCEDSLNFKEHFARQVKDMHPYMIKYFNKDKLIYSNLLKNGEVKINPEPVIFYWGDKSIEEVQSIDTDLSVLSKFTPKVSQLVRSTFAHCLHDAVWVQKYPNMSVVIDELHEVVKNEVSKGNNVILFGYSAGSFITYEYFLNKFLAINPKELSNSTNDVEAKLIVDKFSPRETCLDALLESGLVRLDLYGRYSRVRNLETVAAQFPKLDSYTSSACFADGTVKGVINFASPLALFYSEISDSKSDLNFLSKLMYKHILETDTFWLTVNYREDPLGFPVSRNLTRKQIEGITGEKLNAMGGFVFDKSNVKSGRTFISAHLAYWETQKRFVKGIVDAYNDGYNNLYNNILKDSNEPEDL